MRRRAAPLFQACYGLGTVEIRQADLSPAGVVGLQDLIGDRMAGVPLDDLLRPASSFLVVAVIEHPSAHLRLEIVVAGRSEQSLPELVQSIVVGPESIDEGPLLRRVLATAEAREEQGVVVADLGLVGRQGDRPVEVVEGGREVPAAGGELGAERNVPVSRSSRSRARSRCRLASASSPRARAPPGRRRDDRRGHRA